MTTGLVRVASCAAGEHDEGWPLMLLGAFGGLRIGEMAGLRRGRVDLERGTVQVIEVITEPKGQLHFGPPKTSAGRRMVGLPRFVVDALAERMAGPAMPR
jgi:integrase